ncbi:flagellar basal-body rod protein FlgC [Hoeflea marina]|uniref:Flagellar basal-body rod protein FlgC n=1 Tax=Hoeflea marina TaxID=274592 RepID=A0A317PGR3_9HYPH|nr:flagellar basal body protein [Hoeflea marina]PWV99204.1 flagellar basal-body rod protein FlgC [Hoeflea marina]
MSLTVAMNTSLSGMQAYGTRAQATANNIANAETPGYRRLETSTAAMPGGGVSARVKEADGGVDLGTEILDMRQAEIGFEANAFAYQAGADMWDVLMSLNRDDSRD